MSYIPRLSYRASGWHEYTDGEVSIFKLTTVRRWGRVRERWERVKLISYSGVHRSGMPATPYRAVELYKAYLAAVEAFERHPSPPPHLLDRLSSLNASATVLLQAFGSSVGTEREQEQLARAAAEEASAVEDAYGRLEELVCADARATPGDELAHHHRAIASLRARVAVEEERQDAIHEVYLRALSELEKRDAGDALRELENL